MVAAYVVVFGFLTVRQHQRFGTFGFDMGIHDQGIWLLSRFREPFVTVRGLHYFGHHLNLISLAFVPAYWVGAGPLFLVSVQTVTLALGAVPTFLLARDLIGDRSPWLALVPAAAYLLHPSLSWVNWWHFHPEALALAPLLFAVWLAHRRRWRWFALAVAVALSTKEDIALAVFMLGCVLALVQGRRGGQWRPGALTALAGALWYLASMELLIPYFHGGEKAHYVQEMFPLFGDSAGAILLAIVSDPARTWSILTDHDRLTYYVRLLAPSGFVALLGLPFLLIAGPQVGANALSSLATTYDARFHYTVVPVAGITAATVHAIGFLHRLHRRALLLGLVALAIGAGWSHRAWAPSPLGVPFRTGIWAAASPRHESFDRALASIPADAGLSTNYYLAPHATHRERIYEWPNPWIAGNWGFADRDPHDPAVVDYLVLDLDVDQQPALRERLTRGTDAEFEVVTEADGVLVARRRGDAS